MLYVDYSFHIGDNMIMFDEELKLCEQKNGNEWGNLPKTWKEGDSFILKINEFGRVCFHKNKN